MEKTANEKHCPHLSPEEENIKLKTKVQYVILWGMLYPDIEGYLTDLRYLNNGWRQTSMLMLYVNQLMLYVNQLMLYVNPVQSVKVQSTVVLYTISGQTYVEEIYIS